MLVVMTRTALRAASVFPLAGVLTLAACSVDDEPVAPADSGASPTLGGSPAASGAGPASAGLSAGGASLGGASFGGALASSAGGAGGNVGGSGSNAGGATSQALGGSAGAATAGGGGGPATGTGGSTLVGGGTTENSGSACASMAAGTKANKKLPDPFAMHDGTRISTKAAWACRRNEIKKDLEKYEIGPKPEPPMVAASVSGGKLSVKVTTAAGSLTLSSTIGAAAGSRCVAIGMNGNSTLINGCVQVPFSHDQVVKYGSDSTQYQSDPFYEVYPELWGKIGNYAAWSWGISRLIDGVVQVADELGIDPTKIGVHGCSYAGKMALFAGAFDERVALTIAQESGGGGITSWRTSADFNARTGTNVEKIDNTNFSWFLKSMKTLDPYSLPHDHHELIAMIAPRAVVAMGNQDFEWLGDESGWKSINAAKEVWKALGVPDRIGFDFTSNHGHCAAPASQVASAKAFVDKFLKGQTADTNVAIKPQEGNFDLDFTNVVDWQTPTLQ